METISRTHQPVPVSENSYSLVRVSMLLVVVDITFDEMNEIQ